MKHLRRPLAALAVCTATIAFSTPARAEVWGGFDASRINYSGGVLTGSEHDTLRGVILAGGDSVGSLTSTITASYLATIDVFYVSLLTNNGVPLSAAEQTALKSWVSSGGVLFLTADIFNKTGYNSFGSIVGVGNFTNVSGTPTVTGNHALLNGVTTLDGTSYVHFTHGSDATPLANIGGNRFAAVLDNTSGYQGGGCVLVFGDHNIFTDDFASKANNKKFLENVVSWVNGCAGPPLGIPCTMPSQCATNFCVDGMCCENACGNGATDDCQACSIAAGSSTDGLCNPLQATTECRASTDACDAAESCDGMATTCPMDVLEKAGAECRKAADLCDAVEVCDGINATCPADGVEMASTECRPAADLCDAAELCDGINMACPADDFVMAGTECRAATDLCDAAENCAGNNAACPADVIAPNGTECRAPAGDCDVAETCDGTNVTCPADALAVTDTECRPSVGMCDLDEVRDGMSAACPADANVADGAACDDDDDACTEKDVCAAGVCAGESICGSGGQGGSSGQGGGSSSSSSSSTSSGDADDDEPKIMNGCTCRTAGSNSSSSGYLLLLGLAAAAWRRRRS